MKRLIIALVSVLIMLPLFSGNVFAACSTSNDSYGEVTLGLPKLPTTGTFNIWTRMQVPDSTNSAYELQINDTSCVLVGGGAVGSWQWVNSQVGTEGAKVTYDFTQTSGNTFRLVGVKPGVKIDRLLLVRNDCTPVDLGTNCSSSNSALEVGSGATEVPPISNGPVSGSVIPTSTISTDLSNVARVTYYVGSSAIPANDDFSLDTTLLQNGEQRVTINIVKKDGSTVDEATTLVVNNPENGFSGLWRWARLNKNILFGVGVGLTAVLVAIATFLTFKKARLKKRRLEFRGF